MLSKLGKILFRNINVIVAIFFVIFTLHQLYLARIESATTDESPHIVSGINYLTNYTMSVNPEHPPLFKLAAAIIPKIKHVGWVSNPESTHQWYLGNRLITHDYAHVHLVLWARIGVIILNVLLMLLVYKALSNRYSHKIAAITMALFALNPLVITHAHYVTNDISAALVSLIFIVMIMNRLDHRGAQIKNDWVRLSGAIFLLILTKYSLLYVLGFAYFFVLSITLFDKDKKNKLANRRLLISFTKALLMAFVLVYILFLILTHNQTSALSEEVINGLGTHDNVATRFIFFILPFFNRPLMIPIMQLLSGLSFVLSRVGAGGGVYIHEVMYAHGQRIYFPFVFMIKSAISFLVAIVFSLLIRAKTKSMSQLKLASIFAIIFTLFYLASAIMGNLNIGLRHLSPVIIILCLMVALSINSYPKILFIILFGSTLEVVSFLSKPMSFSNFIIGGANQTHYYTSDSNLDWGQSQLRLKNYIVNHQEFGGSTIGVMFMGQSRDFIHYNFCPKANYDLSDCYIDINRAPSPGQSGAPDLSKAKIIYWEQSGFPDTDYFIASSSIVTDDIYKIDQSKRKYPNIERYPYALMDGTMFIYKLK